MDKIMKSLHVIFILICVLGCTLKSAPGVSPDDVFSRHGFPRFESARHLCQQRVYGSGIEISWDALTSAVQTDRLAAFYAERLGVKVMTQDVNRWTWRLPAGPSRPHHVLSIHPVTADGPWKQCKQPIPSDARTIIMLSTMQK